MVKTRVFNWRVSSDLKTDLKREARRRRMSMSTAIELAAREWLGKSRDERERN